MFMWKWQHVFQRTVERSLENLLKILDFQTETNTFVLGIPVSKEKPQDIFFQPEVCGFSPFDFEEVFSKADKYYEENPEKNLFHTAPHLNEAHQESLYPKALQKAVEDILEKRDSLRISFCSFPIKVNDHWIVTVIQINQKDFDKEYSLKIGTYQLHEYRKWKIARSFLEPVILQLLKESVGELKTESKGYNDSFVNSERVLEDAAIKLLSSIRVRVNLAGADLFDLANGISAERYEGQGSKGRLIICQQENSEILIKLKLKRPIRINNYRGIRKLLEVSSPEMALLCDCECVWGLGVPLNTYDPSREDLFEIRFTDHYTWELVHSERVMLQVKYRKPRLPRERFDETIFRDHVSRFSNTNESAIDILVEAVKAAVEQRHGTILVITAGAEKETERLSAQSTVIEPIPVSRDIISHISSIDGAIIASPNGMIHSFGVILDGLASTNGNPARGARFNSAIRYVDEQSTRNIPCLALIVSEDGYVDLYPTLKPRIHRSLIDNLLQELEKNADLSKEFNLDEARNALNKAEKLRFYFLEQDIDRANQAKNKILNRIIQVYEKEMGRTGIGYIHPQFKDFTVHEKMNQEYYLP